MRNTAPSVRALRPFPLPSSSLRVGSRRTWAALGLGASLLSASAQVAPPSTYQRLKAMTLDELLSVEVTSVSGYAEKLREAPSAIQVISGREIQRSTAQTLPEALRLANNLNIAQKNPHDWAISARGFNANVGNKLLVLMDGRSVYTPLFAGVFWDGQDYLLEDIEQIEVISGPGGTLWGANAVNGVININSKNAQDTQGALVRAGVGDEMRSLVAARYGGRAAPGVYYRVYGKHLTHEAGVLADGTKARNGWEQGRGGFRVDVMRSTTDTFTFQGDVYSGDLDVQAGETARLAGGNLLARWTRNGIDGSETKAQLYADRTHIAVPFAETPFAPAGFIKDDTDTFDFTLRHSRRWGERQRLTGGVGYRFTHDSVKEQAPNFAFLPARLDRSLWSVFVQDDLRLTEPLTVTLGSKLEHNDYTGFEYEPTFRLQWKVAPHRTAWAAVSRAVRMPSRFDRDLYQPAPPNSLLAGGPHFRSETVIAYEAGYRAQLTSRLSGSIAIFYNDYDHLRSWGITPVTVLPVVFENNLQAKTHGAEFDADLQLAPWWRLSGGFVLLRETVRVRPGAFDLQNALDETADPRHQASLHSILDLPANLECDVALRWVDRLRVNHGGLPGAVPAYTELDVRLGWRPSAMLDLSLIGRNLLHARHAEYGPPEPLREELQRSLFAQLTWRY